MAASYQCIMIQATGANITGGAEVVTPSGEVQEIHIEWLTSARPLSISASGPAADQKSPPSLISVFTHDPTDSGVTVTKDQLQNRAATITVVGANGTYSRRAWLTKASWSYLEIPTDPIQFQFAPAAAISGAAPVPFVGEDGYVGLCVILKASDYRGVNKFDITGFGSVVVVGLWDIPATPEASSGG